MSPLRSFWEGTHNIHTLIIGERVAGMPAYK
jgi:alkylation response protein AidB-like acyl-CoA dehydrogenase